uniref:Interleukin 31 receptor A n=1 Tax=Pipistrellus kuhlii TaxID=59472 RepID=A0A7J7YWE6_PIPKU|nr:interleukin 31 receptor A [Pipistrellus kuhlii]
MWAWALWVLPLLCPGGRAAPPAKPENVSCVFYYRTNFTCTWSPDPAAGHTQYWVRRTSFGKKNDTCHPASETPTSCSFFPPITLPDVYTIQVEAQNADGTAASDVTRWSLAAVAKMEAPVISSVTPVVAVKRMLQIQWVKPKLAPASSPLKCRLRFRMANSTHWMQVSFKVEAERNTHTSNLTGLQALTEYEVALSCAVQQSPFWSAWSPVHRGTTEEVPLGLDLWRVLGPAQEDGSRPVRLLWKRALERALSYQVWFFPENTTNLTETVTTSRPQLALTLGAQAYRVWVVAANSLGQSPPASLRVPAATEEAFRGVQAVQAGLSQAGLAVAWQSSAPHVDAWMVEWLPDVDAEPPAPSWEAVTGARNWTIRQDELAPLQCYNISVYPLWQDRVGQPCSVQAYAREGVPAAGPVPRAEGIGVTTVSIVWEEVPKHQRHGFICSYTVFYQAEGSAVLAKTVGARTLGCRLESLRRKTSYSVWVMASTSAGGFNGTRIAFQTLSVSVLEVCLVAALGGGGLLLLSALAAACGLRKPKLKHLCWPDVPNPARSSLAAWGGGSLKGKPSPKEVDDALSTEDSALKPSDLIDKLAVNFENFQEEVSAEEEGKGQESMLGGDTNEYVTSPFRPYCILKPFTEAEAPPTVAEAPPTAAEAPPTVSEVTPIAAEAPPMAAEAPPTSPKAPPTVAEAPPREPRRLRSGSREGTSPEAEEQLVPSARRPGPASACREGAPTLYLKNSVTTREFLVSAELPDQTKRAT